MLAHLRTALLLGTSLTLVHGLHAPHDDGGWTGFRRLSEPCGACADVGSECSLAEAALIATCTTTCTTAPSNCVEAVAFQNTGCVATCPRCFLESFLGAQFDGDTCESAGFDYSLQPNDSNYVYTPWEPDDHDGHDHDDDSYSYEEFFDCSDCTSEPEDCDDLNDMLNGCADDCSTSQKEGIVTAMGLIDPATFGDCEYEEDEDPCFPSEATVTRADGTVARLDELAHGDTIIAATKAGALTTDTVSTLSIADAQVKGAAFVVLTTEDKKALTLTATHHVPVGATCCSNLKEAKDVEVSETIWVADGAANAAVPQKVLTTGKAKGDGRHSPVLVNGGFPVVNGVVTAFDSIGKVTVSSYLLPLLEATGVTGLARRYFLPEERKYLVDTEA